MLCRLLKKYIRNITKCGSKKDEESIATFTIALLLNSKAKTILNKTIKIAVP